MAVICGLWRREGVADGALEPLLAALPGSGANAEWSSPAVLLGCRSRPTALDAGCSPRADPEGRLVVTAAGRIDGREELCDALGVARARLADLADADLILRAYARWGTACPTHLLGDYAFAVWDAPRRLLFCARGHTGACPFYYAGGPGNIAFSSEIGAVLAAPGVDGKLDEGMVRAWLAGGLDADAEVRGERTFRRGVRRLLPGHSLTVTETAERVERWWRPEDAPAAAPARDDDYAEAFLALYRRAVRDCLRGEEPVGAHLSGGLDSSSTAILAARELRKQGRPPPPGFAWHPPPPTDRPRNRNESFEYGLIESVCRQEGIAAVWCPPSSRDWLAFYRSDVTLGQVAGIVAPELSVQRRAAERGVRVLLSGWGGDEVASFYGRGYHEELLLRGRLVRLWRQVGMRTRHPLAYILAFVALPLAVPRAGPALRGLRRRLLRLPRPGGTRMGPHLRSFSVRHNQLRLLRMGHVGERAEGWAESGARRDIEYRYPLLDRRLLDFALGLPGGQYMRGQWDRWLMRRALSGVLPEAVCWNRRKADPVRVQGGERPMEDARAEARRIIAARTAPYGRERFVDVPALAEALAAADNSETATSSAMHALRLLDF